MRRPEPLRLTWRNACVGILTEVAYVGGICLVAGLIAFLVDWGVR